MAYFANGSEGVFYEERYCARCVHDKDDSCPVLLLHLLWNYDAVGKDADQVKAKALNALWPRKADGIGNDACAMFFERPGEKEHEE